MSADGIAWDPPEAGDKLSAALQRYRKTSGKTAGAVLVQKGAQVIHGNRNPKYGATFKGLYGLFRDERPAKAEITASARARGWRLGRISVEARQRAERRLGGYASILAIVTEDSDGKITLRGARVGKRGRRVSGGRRGLGGFAIEGTDTEFRREGDVRLNFRAVQVIEEINVREGGRGFIAASWLFKRWRKLAQSDPRRDAGAWRREEQVNPRSRLRLLGEAQLTGNPESGRASLRISSRVPGALEVGQAHNLFGRVMSAVLADLEAYLARKEEEEAAAVLQAAGLPVR